MREPTTTHQRSHTMRKLLTTIIAAVAATVICGCRFTGDFTVGDKNTNRILPPQTDIASKNLSDDDKD